MFLMIAITFCYGDEVIDYTTPDDDEYTAETIEEDTESQDIINDSTLDYNTTNTIEDETCYDETTSVEEVTVTTETDSQTDDSDSLWYADYSFEEYFDDEVGIKNISSFKLDKGYVGGTVPVLNRKVHRGNRASVYEFPFVVSIRRNRAHYQIGVVLTLNLILTVANGIYNVPIYDMTVVQGENYSDRGNDFVPIILYIIHPDFNPFTLQANVALLRTICDMIFKGNLKEILLLRNDIMIYGTEATLVGWGRCDLTGKEVCLPRSNEFFPNEISDPMLRSVRIPIIESKFCNVYTDVMNLTLYPGMMCVGPSRLEQPMTPCMAVPGAPLIAYSHLIGLQSWGYGCGYEQDLPIVYTDLRYYLPWLEHELTILVNITNHDLNELLIGSQSYVLVETLRQLRGKERLKNRGFEKLEMYDLDHRISEVAGKVYDYRDFIFNGVYSKQKQDAYVSWKVKRYKMKLMYINETRTECPLPFIKNEDRHYLYQDENDEDQND